jgi:prevent-host-death family protein
MVNLIRQRDLMEKSVSATDAKRRFSNILRAVGKGWSYVIVEDGRPLAKLIPLETNERNATAARAALLARLKSQTAKSTKMRWKRDELYEK